LTEQIVLSHVTTGTSGSEDETVPWRVRADGNGTVVVASTSDLPGKDGAVVAAIRDPGGRFDAQQELTPPSEPPLYERQLSTAPIEADGSVEVAWDSGFGGGLGGRGRSAIASAGSSACGVSAPPKNRPVKRPLRQVQR
jgi:hypothetical protein